MEAVQRILTTLSTPDAINVSGFMIGFMYRLKFTKETLDRPLSTLFDSSISGFFTLLGAQIVADFLPPQLRFFIPLLAVCSSVYYKLNDVIHPPRTNRTPCSR